MFGDGGGSVFSENTVKLKFSKKFKNDVIGSS